MPRHIQGYVCLALAMVTVGSTVIAGKLIGAGLPPFTATALRLALALPFFLAFMRLTATPWPRVDRRDAMLLIVQATAGSVLYTALLILGLRHISAANAGVIIGTLPVVSAAIAIVVLGERPRPAVLLAVALAAAGVFTIVFEPRAAGTSSLAGSALVFAAILCEGLFILLNKRLRVPMAPLAQSTLMTALGLLVALVPALLEAPWTAPMTASSLWAMVYYALVPTVGGYLLWYAGLARVSGAEAALFTAMAPVSAVLLAFAVLSETVGLHQMIGIGLVLFAVLSLGLVRNRGRAPT